MKHYYTDNSDLKSEPRMIDYEYKHLKLQFKSDLGVFSKDKVDYGSNVLLKNIDNIKDNATILDVGCGYGPIGITLAKLYPNSKIDMIDVNNRALSLARENIILNHIENRMNVYQSDGYNEVTTTYDVIVSNPPIRAGKEVVHRILEEAIQHLNQNGSLWIVLQKKQGAPSAKKKMIDIFGNCEIVKRDKGYYLLVSYKNKKP